MWKLILIAVVITSGRAQNIPDRQQAASNSTQRKSTWRDCTYMIIAPSKVRANMDLSLSVHILNASSNVMLLVTLSQGQKTVVSANKVFRQGAPEIFKLKLPADLPNSIYTLKVKGSGALTFNQSTDLSYNSKEAFSVFIQINKAIFKPDDTVNFRVFGIYPDLKSYSGSMDVSIYDANSNKIKQWNKVNPVNGVFTQKLVLSAQPVLGDWKIEAKANTTRAQKIFTVAKYVLPKFKVEIVMPSFALTSDNDITVTIKSRYTYDKPVKGTADVLVKLNQFENSMPIDFAQSLPVTSLQMSINGEAKVTVPKDLINAKDKDVLIVIANVTESLTGNKMTAKNTVTFYDQVAQLEYPEINPKSFKPGLKYSAYLQITQPDGLPTTSITEPVRISWKVEKEKKPLDSIRLRLPKNGIVSFSVNVPLNASSLIISATFQGVTKELTVEPSYSPSSSYMQLALKTASVIRAGDVVFFEVTSTTPMTQLVYQVLSKGVIVKVGSENATSKFSHQFSVVSDSSMAPSARMVIYFYRRDGEIVIDSISFDVSGAFKNKVSFGFNSKSVDPGNNVTVTVRADPNSAAYLLAIDQSVLLIRGDNDVTSDDVFTDLKKYDTAADSAECSTCKSGLWPSWTLGGAVALEIFTKAGVVALTDAVIIQSKPSDENEDSWLMRNPGAIMVPMVPKQIRQVFTETFLWSDLTIGVNGSASITATVPDTITSWVASAFAVNSESGLGIAPSQSYLQVFRPFFVSLNLPYSVIRGEHLVVQANVFNYMTEDMQVTVTLAASDKFYNIEIDANGANGLFQQSQSVKVIMVEAGEAISVYFPIFPHELGKIDIEVKAQSTSAADAVRRQLLVEAEGIPKTKNYPILIDLTEGRTSFSQTINLPLPSNTVKDSQRTRFSVVGDLMGPTIAGLDALLQMPTGSGEQNMVNLAPNIYVVNYLQSVNQLSTDIKSKAFHFMEKGYQRELMYRHPDGSFSNFGSNDTSGNIWLTAFVVKIFHQAQGHIYIDDNVLIEALQWIVTQQNPDGSFQLPSKGQAGSSVVLTLHVLISLFENEDVLVEDNIVEARGKALTFVESEVDKTNDLYVLSLAAYTFQLAGSTRVQAVLDKLELRATVKGGRKYWILPEQPKKKTTLNYPNQTKSIDIEITSYVLLTYAVRGNLVAGKSIMWWLAEQRNSQGGFPTARCSIIALNALAVFAEKTYRNNFNMKITAKVAPQKMLQYRIDRTNALILQSGEVSDVPAQVQIEATGSGLVLAQIAVSFNVESEIFRTTFDLKVTLVEESMNYFILQTCTKWIGSESDSVMTVQEIGIPTGFEADLDSIPNLENLKRIESQFKNLYLYIDQIDSTPVCLTMKAVRIGVVSGLQPSTVRVIDYYEPSNQVTAFYQSQILEASIICDVCKECDNCF
ncbi:CD109 antigen-like isoform X2 [Biomphalaria glabrata]|nr:CD109 antigen-like isoform X2 [Biomphalaria glabrata]XP_055894440.1 CD109 antigen-like isoform X2 [Biomphalaria glabrata]XP_055894441.1 CD109 antigen-like isoform X2 [Biomphalaria glabrata]